jgi:hypothetical protein
VGEEIYDVFVSYSRADWRHAAEIDAALRARGLKPFFDRNLSPGLRWVCTIDREAEGVRLNRLYQEESAAGVPRRGPASRRGFLVPPAALPVYNRFEAARRRWWLVRAGGRMLQSKHGTPAPRQPSCPIGWSGCSSQTQRFNLQSGSVIGRCGRD